MAWLDRILRRPPTETRDAGFAALSRALAEAYGGSGGPVSPMQAERLSTVTACTTLIAGAIASLPASIMLGGAPAPPTTPAWRILKRPNAMQSWPSFASFYVRQMLLTGNGLARADEDGRGAVVGLTPVPWSWAVPRVLLSDAGARLAYDVENRSSEARLLGLPPRLLADEVLHTRLHTDDGITGRSVIARTAAAVREGLSLTDAALATWRNGLRPSMVFTMDSFLNDARRKRFDEETKEKLVGSINAGGWALLEGGMKATPVSMNSVDAQFLETRGLNAEQVCNIFNVPSILIRTGAHAVADLAPYVTALAQMALAPICTAIEHEFNHSVLGDGDLTLSLDLDGLQRGSFAAVVAALAALKQSAIITGNDARAELGWPPRADGDVLAAGPAPSWPADGPGMPHLGPSPGPRGGDGLAVPGTHQDGGAS